MLRLSSFYFLTTGLLLALPILAFASGIEYFVTGFNVMTKERIVGWIDGELNSTNVNGTVLDRGDRFNVTGHETGVGTFELRSSRCTYNAKAVDEVSWDKRENRRRWDN